MPKNAGLVWGLFCLRWGMGLFLALLATNKIMTPVRFVTMYSNIWFSEVNTSAIMLLGGIELAISLFIILGVYKAKTYGAGLVLQLIFLFSIAYTSSLPLIQNVSFLSNCAVFFAFIALFLMRNHDTKWVLAKKKSIFFD